MSILRDGEKKQLCRLLMNEKKFIALISIKLEDRCFTM